MPEFDAYLMVDWSASSRPATGADSIWYCLMTRSGTRLQVVAFENPATRVRAIGEIREILLGLARQGRTVLVGFDFPFGYPAGFADALRLVCDRPWDGVWSELVGSIVDRADNSNNRFDVAGELNRRVSGACGPFWGCPRNRKCTTLSSTKGPGGHLAERRLTDVGNMQPIWKLYGNGSVGSQALVGIPHVAALRNHPGLATVSRVWPFETGLVRLPNREDRDCLIVLAEIYPSLVAVRTTPGGVKDALRVEATASHFAALDDAGELSTLFAGPDWLTADERVRVEREEGWTLGVTSRRPERIPSPEQIVVMESCDATASECGLPTCDFVYFATPACAPETITAEFVNSAKAIIAHAYNRLGQRMPLVQALRPGDQILLVYGSAGKYRPVFRCRIRAPEERVRLGIQRFDGFCYIAERLLDQLKSAGYEPDPVIQRFVGIAIELVEDLRQTGCTIVKPKGNNTLRRWNEVFRPAIGDT
jgi:hypothetical protein